MSKLTRALAVTLLAASIPATVVLAQPADTPPGAGPGPAAAQTGKYRAPSPETMKRLEDGRIAMAKAALKLTPEQEKLWAPVEEKIRAGYAERSKARAQWRAKREERRANRAARGTLALPERVARRAERMAQRATRMSERAQRSKELAVVLKPFYESLSDEQKAVAAHVLRRVAGGKRGWRGRHGHHGRRWAMGGGGMGGRGMGGPGMGRGARCR